MTCDAAPVPALRALHRQRLARLATSLRSEDERERARAGRRTLRLLLRLGHRLAGRRATRRLGADCAQTLSEHVRAVRERIATRQLDGATD
jgi:hypothetical protein